MNIDLDLSIVRRVFQRILNDLREKRLWPIALVLLVALPVVPLLLVKSSGPAPVAQAPEPTPPPSQATSLPALNVETTPSHSRLTGRDRDPFAQQVVATQTSATTSTVTATASTTSSSGATSNVAGGSSVAQPATSGTSGTSRVATAPMPSITQNAKAKPVPAGLTPTQSYRVSVAITNSSGGLDAIRSLERLSVVPSNNQPLLVELGVAKGGRSVLFAVQPGAVVAGQGKCTPGRIDCEVLSLAPDQTESLYRRTPTGLVAGPLFAVTGITVENHSSVAAAANARRAASAAGRTLLSKSTLNALALFRYEPSVGAVVDLRDLTVGVS